MNILFSVSIKNRVIELYELLSGKITDIKNVEETYTFENSAGENIKVESINKTEVYILKEDGIHTVIDINSSKDFMVGDNIGIIGLKCLSNKRDVIYNIPKAFIININRNEYIDYISNPDSDPEIAFLNKGQNDFFILTEEAVRKSYISKKDIPTLVALAIISMGTILTINGFNTISFIKFTPCILTLLKLIHIINKNAKMNKDINKIKEKVFSVIMKKYNLKIDFNN